MKRALRLRPSLGTVLGGMALLFSLGGVAFAAIPGGNGTVTACLSKNGSLKVIDSEAGKTCDSGQTTLRLAATDVAGKVSDADKLDGIDSTGFLAAGGKATDADKLDGIDSTGFLAAGGKATDADKLDGIDSAGFLAAGGKAADADKLDGKEMRVAQALPTPGAVSDGSLLDGFFVFASHDDQDGTCAMTLYEAAPGSTGPLFTGALVAGTSVVTPQTNSAGGYTFTSMTSLASSLPQHLTVWVDRIAGKRDYWGDMVVRPLASSCELTVTDIY